MKTIIEVDDLRTEGLDRETIDLGIVNMSSESPIDLGITEMEVGIRGLSAYEIAKKNGFVGTEKEWLESLDRRAKYTIEKDSVLDNTYNLVDGNGKVNGSITLPTDIHIIRANYDNELRELVFTYNDGSGKKPLTIPLEDMGVYGNGDGLEIVDGKLCVKIDGESHKALSVSENGLKLDGRYFADKKDSFYSERYSNKNYTDY